MSINNVYSGINPSFSVVAPETWTFINVLLNYYKATAGKLLVPGSEDQLGTGKGGS